MNLWKSLKNTVSVIGGVSLVFSLSLILPDISSSQTRLDAPTANPEIKNPVPFPLIRKIALLKSKEVWGNGALGDPIPLSDLDGNLAVYLFPYHIGGERFPNYDEILKGVKEGRELKGHIRDSRIDKAREIYMGLDHGKPEPKRDVVMGISEVPARPEIEAVRPDGSPSRSSELAEVRKIERFAARHEIGADEYGTIIVSATYDRFPVLAYLHYLPPYYFNFDRALERAEQIKGKGAAMKKIYFLGIEGQYFEFENNGNQILLNSKTLETTSIETLRGARGSDAQISEDSMAAREKIRERLTEEWKKINAEAGTE